MVAAALALVAVGFVAPARAACVPRTGLLGRFPFHMDVDVPVGSRFLFEIGSYPAEPINPSFTLHYGGAQLAGDFKLLYPLGPVGSPHATYLYEFSPRGLTETMYTYTSFLRYTLAGGGEKIESAAFSFKDIEDSTPPEFGGADAIVVTYGTPERAASGSGYDCVLGEGTFLVARMKVPPASPDETAAQRRDGMIFTAYQADESGSLGDVVSRSVFWPRSYMDKTVPTEWLFIVEVNPPPDTERCFVVRASDMAGHSEDNVNVRCATAPGPAILAPGAGAPGFFAREEPAAACSVAGERGRVAGRPGPVLAGLAVCAAVSWLCAAARRSRR